MHRHNVLLACAAVALFVLVLSETPRPKVPPPTPLEAPVPLLETTPTTDAGAIAARFIPGKLPPPGPNQLRAGKCDPEQSHVEINGGCWVKTERPPPCPRGKQWEHEGRCWLPVAPAKQLPQSGEPRPRGVADP